MITLNLIHIVIFITFAAACVGFFLFYKKIERMKKEHESEISDIQSEIKELEKMAQEKIEKTEKAYEEALKSLSTEVEFYQKYMIDVNTAITLSDNKLREIDVAGTFAADDEIGWFFKTVKDIQKILNEFKTEVQERKF